MKCTCPYQEGMQNWFEHFEEKEALRLEKAIYGLVQAARQFLMKI